MYAILGITLMMADAQRPGKFCVLKSADGINYKPFACRVSGQSDCDEYGGFKSVPSSVDDVICQQYPLLTPKDNFEEVG